jgi:predicted type IV restriction endonuclease
MKILFEDIRDKLERKLYQNEEQIRMQIVARILKTLGWDIWNPEFVRPEFKAGPNEKQFVDLALFTVEPYPQIYIEIKSANKLSNAHELNKAELQLRDYNVDLTSLFTILTDGLNWRFYYSQEGGSFSQKCFKTLNLHTDNLEDLEFNFIHFLSERRISSGLAKQDAHELLQMTKKQRAIEESFPQVKREILLNLELTPPQLLQKIVSQKGYSISIEEAASFLKSESMQKDTPQQTILPQGPVQQDYPTKASILTFDKNNMPDLRHTFIISGKVEMIDSKNWNDLLRKTINILINRGEQIDDIRKVCTLNISYGIHADKGFHKVAGTVFSLQNVSANVAVSNLSKLTQFFKMNAEITFEWRNNPDAVYPGKRGIIKF